MSEPKGYKAKLADFKPDPRNLNKHTQRGRGMVEASQRQRGFGRPGFAAKDGTILGGNLSIMEVAADIELGDGEVFVVETDGDIPVVHLRRDLEAGTPEAVLLAAEDNQSALVSIDFDTEAFAEEIAQGVDFSGIFTADEQMGMLAELGTGGPGETGEPPIDKAAELQAEYGTALGQIWALGEHRLAVGDCTDMAVVEAVMEGEKADIEIHDPPYGMRLDTDWSSAKSRLDFAAAKGVSGGEIYKPVEGDFVDYDPAFLFNRDPPKEMFLWGADYYAERIPNKNDGSWLIWDKRLDESADRMYGSSFETCWSLSRHKRDIIRVKWAWIFGTEKEPGKHRYHPTQKPVLVYEWILDKYSKQGDITADFYLGAGSHLIAAHQLNRRCRGIELDPGYCAVTINRWETLTGDKAELL